MTQLSQPSLLGLLLLLAGCGGGEGAAATAPPTTDGGPGDTGSEADGGHAGDAASHVDAADTEEGGSHDSSVPDGDGEPPDAPKPVVEYQTITLDPLASDQPLNNPGIGVEQASKIINPTGVLTMNSTVDAISTIRYLRLQWSLIEPNGDNAWNWEPLDAAIEASVASGKQAAIALMGHSPVLGGTSGYTQAVPAWYMSAAEARGPRCTGVGSGDGTPAGCTYYRTDYKLACNAGETCSNLWTFNHNDPAYLVEQIELIEALRARYDNPTWAGKIAYVDVRGGLGSWTELHVDGVVLSGTSTPWPMPNWTTKKAIADAYLSFEHIPIVANIRNGGTSAEAAVESMWVYLCEQARTREKVVGWRTDGLDSTKWLMDPVFSAHPDMEDCWRLGPVHGELTATELNAGPVEADPWANGATGYDALNRRLAAWHASGWNTKYKSYPGDPAYGGALDAWRSFGGYRIAAVTARMPSIVGASDPFDVQVDLANFGTAPAYRDYHRVAVRLHPQTGGEDIVLPLEGDFTSIMPGEPATPFRKNACTVAETGQYDVSVGVVQDTAYVQVNPLRLANDAAGCSVVGATFWCNVGTLEVQGGGR